MAKKTHSVQNSITQKTENQFSWALILGLLAVVTIVYSAVFQNTFTNWDDELYVTKSAVMQAVGKGNWAAVFTENVASNYHPLTMLSLAINYKMGGLEPFGYQLVNLIFHLLNTFLVFVFFWHFTGKKQTSALLIAALFALHPMHVESVAWVSERKDVLYSFFFLLGMINYWKYLETEHKKHFYYALLLFLASLLSKPAAIIFPFIILLLDFYKGRSWDKNVFLEKIPFFVLSIVFAVLTLQIQSKSAIASVEKFSIVDRFFFACYGLSTYLVKLFLPTGLSAIHPFPKNLEPIHYLSLLGAIAILGLLFWQKNNKNIVFGVLFYVINLVLVLQFVAIGNAVIAERYTYIPYLGIFFILAYLIKNQSLGEKGSQFLKYGCFAALPIFAFLTFNQVKTWKNSETLWTKAIESYPTSTVALSNRALVYYNAGQNKKAIDDLNISLTADSNHVKSLQFRSLAQANLKLFEPALKDAEHLVAVAPNNPDAYMARAGAYSGLGNDDLAIADYTKTIELAPNMVESYNNRGSLFFNRKKDYQHALEDFNKALTINPKMATSMINRSYCYYFLGDKGKALIDANAAIQLGAKPSEAYMQSLR